MKQRPVWLFGLVGLAATLAMACSDGDGVTSSQIFQAPPWTGPEVAAYRVEDKGIEGEGTCVLTTTPGNGEEVILDRHCEKDEFTDTGVLRADAQSLRPILSERIYVDGEDDETTTYTVEYRDTEAYFAVDDGDRKRDTTRDLPEAGEGEPEPGYYDDESLLWLARGIPHQDGWEGGYTHVINAGQPRILEVAVSVSEPERLTVPAGTFDAWKIRFQRESSVYFVWVDIAEPHRVIQARIEDVTYELTSFGDGS